jgi:hypothetical protein
MKEDQIVLTCRVERELYNQLLSIAGRRQLEEQKNVSVSALVRIALEAFTEDQLTK